MILCYCTQIHSHYSDCYSIVVIFVNYDTQQQIDYTLVLFDVDAESTPTTYLLIPSYHSATTNSTP